MVAKKKTSAKRPTDKKTGPSKTGAGAHAKGRPKTSEGGGKWPGGGKKGEDE